MSTPSGSNAPGYDFSCPTHAPSTYRQCRCPFPLAPRAPEKTDLCPECRNGQTYGSMFCKHWSAAVAKHAADFAVWRRSFKEPDQVLAEPAPVPRALASKQSDQPEPKGFFTANGEKYPLDADDAPEAVAEHLARTAARLEEARKHPEVTGLTAEEIAYFDKRVGTVDQRLRAARLLPNATALAYSLANLFPGNPTGFYQRHDDGSYHAVHREATVLDFLAHISGYPNRGLLSVPILPNGKCRWGAIDVDRKGEKDEPIDWTSLAIRVTELNLPLVVCRSKGGKGAWLFIFFKDEDGLPAGNAERLLTHYAQLLSLGKVEIFPKQEDLDTSKGFGSGINLPYRLSLETFTSIGIAFGKQGEPLDAIRDFINLAFERAVMAACW